MRWLLHWIVNAAVLLVVSRFVSGRCARLAAFLSALQIGLFLLLVWVPIVAAGSKIPFQWSETILNAALLAAAWMVADSYQNTPSLVADRQQSLGRRAS